MRSANEKSSAQKSSDSDAESIIYKHYDTQTTRGNISNQIPNAIDHSQLNQLVVPDSNDLKTNPHIGDVSSLRQSLSSNKHTERLIEKTGAHTDINSSFEHSSGRESVLSKLKHLGQYFESVSEMVLPFVGFGLLSFGSANLGLSAICWAAAKTLTSCGVESPYLLQSLITESSNYGLPTFLVGLSIGYALWDSENAKNRSERGY